MTDWYYPMTDSNSPDACFEIVWYGLARWSVRASSCRVPRCGLVAYMLYADSMMAFEHRGRCRAGGSCLTQTNKCWPAVMGRCMTALPRPMEHDAAVWQDVMCFLLCMLFKYCEV
jgi:hypothetical protein